MTKSPESFLASICALTEKTLDITMCLNNIHSSLLLSVEA